MYSIAARYVQTQSRVRAASNSPRTGTGSAGGGVRLRTALRRCRPARSYRTVTAMTKHKSSDERRAQILAAARSCFIDNGYAHTRVDDIARHAGLSKGGVYFHFKSKREIFDALLSEQQARTAARVAEVAASGASTVDKIVRLGTEMVRSFSSGDEHGKFLIVLAEMGIRERDVYRRVVAAHEQYISALTATIREGQERGELREVDARTAAVFLKMLMDGLEQGIALGYELDVDQLAAVGFEILFKGLLRQ